MKTNLLLLALAIFLFTQCDSTDAQKKDGPPSAKVEVVEQVYFGQTVSDPYRYMENLEDEEVQTWFKAQADYSRGVLNSIQGRQGLIDKMREFDGRRSSRISYLNITDDDRYFYLKMTPEDETGKLFYRDGYEGIEYLLYDPQSFGNNDDQKYVISSVYPSNSGNKVAFEIAADGSENSVLLIMDVDNNNLAPEQIDRCWFASCSWLPNDSGFLYNRLQSSDVHDMDREKNSKTYIHLVGTDPSSDREIFSREMYPELGIQPEDFPIAVYDVDVNYLFGFAYTVDRNLNVFYAPAAELANDRVNWKQLFTPEDMVHNFTATKKELYIYTPKGAPNFKLLKTSLKEPDINNASTVVAQDPSAILTSYSLSKDGLFYTLSKNGVQEKLYLKAKDNKPAVEIELPFAAGSVSLRTKGFKFHDVWVGISGWTSNYQRYRYLAKKEIFQLENLSSVAEFPEYDDLVSQEFMIKSHDGVMVPLSIVHKKGLKKDGSNPVFFYGYGAYGASMSPFFSPEFLLWTREGGILAVAHVRGGGELGEQWHRDGFKTTKPNTWKDLIASAEFMVAEKYTSPQKIAINSGSAGGILVGRAMTERPDLFAVAIPEVGCMNTLRGEDSPNGPVNIPEFGTSKDSVECMALIEMDSYLHIVDGEKYPATLATAGMNDPRVIAWQPGKFAARLQAANASDKPILFLPDYEAGHGMGEAKSKRFEGLADVLSFALWQTGDPDFQVE